MNEDQVKDNLNQLLSVARSLVRQLPEDSDTRKKVLPALKALRGAVAEEAAELC